MKSMKQILSKLMSFIKDIHVYTTLSLILCIKYQKCIRYKTIAVLLKYFFLTWPFLNLLMLHCLICHMKVNDVTLTFIELKVKAMAHFRLCTKTTQALCVASYILICVWLWVKLMPNNWNIIVMILFWLSNLEAIFLFTCYKWAWFNIAHEYWTNIRPNMVFKPKYIIL